jgi:uncharacterized protein YbjQ (UPF0145 family)
MSNPALPPGVPEMPAIRYKEQYTGMPFVLADGLPRTIGWQWPGNPSGAPVFVVATRGMLGAYKAKERYPLTAAGWASAWRMLTATDPGAAPQILAELRTRAAADADQPREPEDDTCPVLIVTTNEIPGYRITQVHGDVFGLTVRVRGAFSNLGASLQSVVGGEVTGYTKLLTDSRNQARQRMWREARARGGNAVVAMRFDCNEIGDIMSEIAAYGTAVTAEPIDPAVTATGF